MKRINFPQEEEIKPVILYFDDLERIVEILKELSNNIVIFTDKYELDSLHELQEIHKDTLNWLTLGIAKPQVSVNFRPNGILLYIEEDIPVSRGILEKVKQLLRNCKRKLSWLAMNSWIGATIIGGSIFFFSSRSFMGILLGCLMTFLGAILLWWGHGVIDKKWSVIHLKRRIELPSFWKRNKDRIVVAIISITFGSLITLVITNLLKKP